MHLRTRLTVIGLGALLLAGVVMPSPPASAVAVGAISGGGTIAPGLTEKPENQTAINFTAVGAGLIQGLPATCNIEFNGHSNGPETILTGDGVGYASCDGYSVTGEAVGYCCFRIDYSRVGAVVIASGWDPFAAQHFRGVFLFEPTSAPPVVTYLLQGVFEIENVV